MLLKDTWSGPQRGLRLHESSAEFRGIKMEEFDLGPKPEPPPEDAPAEPEAEAPMPDAPKLDDDDEEAWPLLSGFISQFCTLGSGHLCSFEQTEASMPSFLRAS